MWNVPDDDRALRESIATTYWKAEQKWKTWRMRNPLDFRIGTALSGSPEEDEIAADCKAFETLFMKWVSKYPAPRGYFWGIEYPSHEPKLCHTGGRQVFIEC
jgi:hypothetical protein